MVPIQLECRAVVIVYDGEAEMGTEGSRFCVIFCSNHLEVVIDLLVVEACGVHLI